jgi:hypothetical protein
MMIQSHPLLQELQNMFVALSPRVEVDFAAAVLRAVKRGASRPCHTMTVARPK